MSRAVCSEQRLVDRHFAGQIRPADEGRLRGHLNRCAACYAYYERHQLLQALDPRALSDEERIAQGLGLSRRRAPWPVLAGAVGAAAACLLVVLLLRGIGVPDRDFQRRGGGGAPEPTALRIFKTARGAPPARLGQTIAPGDELAFAYINGAGKTHLLVFAVDDRGRVYWYHPAWTDPRAAPRAVPIKRQAILHELPDATAHAYKGSRLTIHGVFTDRPVSVLEVERTIARNRGRVPARVVEAAVHVTRTVRIIR